jgi:tRNA-specific 2-thiouridylase
MKNWEGDDTDTHCPAALDLADAQTVCDQLDIPLHVVNFADKYWERVFAHFLAEYQAGRTPNPDILCNKEIKFTAFLDYAKQCGADYIATGHYARIRREGENTYLMKGPDPLKDQSYFLCLLNQSQLAQSIFPVGDLTKTQVRALAQQLHLKTHDKKDSTGICFIGERKFKTFLNDYLPAKIGKIITLTGEVIGQHDGLMFYTIGQRQGLQIGGCKGKAELPWYVVDKDMQRNVLLVAQGENHPALFKKSLIATALHWINTPPTLPLPTTAKIRYRQPDQACDVTMLNAGRYQVNFAQPQRAVTPGQAVVFYQDDICLGGGIIE